MLQPQKLLPALVPLRAVRLIMLLWHSGQVGSFAGWRAAVGVLDDVLVGCVAGALGWARSIRRLRPAPSISWMLRPWAKLLASWVNWPEVTT